MSARAKHEVRPLVGNPGFCDEHGIVPRREIAPGVLLGCSICLDGVVRELAAFEAQLRMPVAQELARRDFVEKLAGKQDPDGVYSRETEYDGKTGQWRQKLTTPEGRTFYYGRPGVDPTKFGLSPEKLELANFQKASSEYETLVALTKPENKAALRRALAEQFGGSEDEFRGALEAARGRVQQMQAKREADATLRREACLKQKAAVARSGGRAAGHIPWAGCLPCLIYRAMVPTAWR